MNPNHSKDLTLDPQDWDGMRALGHQMIDDLMDYWQEIREKPVWRPIPEEVKDFFDSPIPAKGQAPEEVYSDFQRFIFPYNKGNVHPSYLLSVICCQWINKS